MINFWVLALIILLFVVITALWGQVNLMRGREQVMNALLKSFGGFLTKYGDKGVQIPDISSLVTKKDDQKTS